MRKFRKTLLFLLMLGIGQTTLAQSMDRAKQYYEEGNYLEAAKQLRPLADGGDDEAQLMAAKLFFEGKGVTKNDAQGIKYATLAADQGNTEAIELLVRYYKGKKDDAKAYATAKKYADQGNTEAIEMLVRYHDEKKDNQTFPIAKKYADQHPELKKSYVGMTMARCMMDGTGGAEKNEDAAWELLEQNYKFNELLAGNDERTAKSYWEYKAREAGKKTIDELVEYFYWEKSDYTKSRQVDEYLSEKYSTIEALAERADSGSVWAMDELTKKYKWRGEKQKALEWAKKARVAGSRSANSQVEELEYEPIKYTRISVGQQTNRFHSIESVEVEYDRVIINCVFRNDSWGSIAWTAASPETYISYGGRQYKMESSTLPIYPKTRSVTKNETLRYSYTYYLKLRGDDITFDIIEDKKVIYSNVRLLDDSNTPTKTTGGLKRIFKL